MRIVVTIFIALIGFVFYVASLEYRVQSACVAVGYPDSRIFFTASGSYCVKRVDQTDIVIPYDSARTLRRP